jgi:hypothetical protein
MHNLNYNQDWDAISKDPSLCKSYRPSWIFGHDCQTYTYQEYPKVLKAIETEQEYIPHNIPEGGKLDLDLKFANLEDKPCFLD